MAVGKTSSVYPGYGDLILLQQQTASSSASLSFESFISASFDEYIFEFINLVPATNSIAFWMRMGTGAPVSYDTATNYGWAAFTYRAGASGQTGAEGGATKIQVGYNTDIDNTATSGITGSLRLFSPQSTSVWKMVSGELAYRSGGNRVDCKTRGSYESTTAITGVQFLMSSGNITSGTIRVYGVSKSIGVTKLAYADAVNGYPSLDSGLLMSQARLPKTGTGAPGMILLEQYTATSSATIDFTTFITSTYDEYLFELINVVPATNAVNLYMRMGTGAGPSWDTGNNYSYADYRFVTTPASANGGSTSQAQILVTNGTDTVSNASNTCVNATLRLFNPQTTSNHKYVRGETCYVNSGSSLLEGTVLAARYSSTTALTGIRFLFSSGNITSGTFRVYGIPK